MLRRSNREELRVAEGKIRRSQAGMLRGVM
jgi:hypothetical protein